MLFYYFRVISTIYYGYIGIIITKKIKKMDSLEKSFISYL